MNTSSPSSPCTPWSTSSPAWTARRSIPRSTGVTLVTAAARSRSLDPAVTRRHTMRGGTEPSTGLQFPSVACPRCGGTSRVSLAPGYWRCSSEVVDVAPSSENGRGAHTRRTRPDPTADARIKTAPSPSRHRPAIAAPSLSALAPTAGCWCVATTVHSSGIDGCAPSTGAPTRTGSQPNGWGTSDSAAMRPSARGRSGWRRSCGVPPRRNASCVLSRRTRRTCIGCRLTAAKTKRVGRRCAWRSTPTRSRPGSRHTCTTGSEAGRRWPPPSRVRSECRTIIGPRCVNRDAWVFTSSTVRRRKDSGWAHDSIGLLSDGTLLLLRGDSAGPWVDMPQPASPLGPHGLKQMAGFLDLPVLEPVPRSAHPLPVPRRD